MFSSKNIPIAKSIMKRDYVYLYEGESIAKLIKNILLSNEREAIILNSKKELKGLISLTDLSDILRDYNEYESIFVDDFMQKDIISIEEKESLENCRTMMIDKNIGVLPVIKDNKVIGIINQKHIRDFFHNSLEDYYKTIEYIFSEIKEGICAIDVEGKVVLWNKFMEDRYDIKSEDIIGKNIEKYLKETVSYRVLKSKKREDGIYKYKSKELYGLVNANPVFNDDELLGVVCTEIDVTEYKNLSKKLEKVQEQVSYLKNEVKNLSESSFDHILGKSYVLEQTKQKAKIISKTNSSIFIFGESGTGKEVFARAIHDLSERTGQFVAINCSAIPSELFESEFFGYDPGAFTGANKKGKAGIFELAKDGTVFLDEVADLPVSMQAKLLRVLEQKEIRRVGGDKDIKINARIISATNKNLLDLVQEEKFREDLYYRLNVVQLDLPPLRDRKEDIPILIQKFINEICTKNNREIISIDVEAIMLLQKYKWKGNIRELKNIIENIIILSSSNQITKENIPDYILDSIKNNFVESQDSLNLNEAVGKVERHIIKKALDMSNGNKSKASKILSIPRTTLIYKIQNYKL